MTSYLHALDRDYESNYLLGHEGKGELWLKSGGSVFGVITAEQSGIGSRPGGDSGLREVQ